MRNKTITHGLFAVILACITAVPMFAKAEDLSFTVPHPPEAKMREQSETRTLFSTELSHGEALSFYKDFVKSLTNIKTIDRSDCVQIVDHGNRPWHSIEIAKSSREGQLAITIVGDSWSWILGTLVLRFIGVFVVLIVLFIGMSMSGKIVSRFVPVSDSNGDDKEAHVNLKVQHDQELVAVAIAAATHCRNRQQGAV